MSATTNFKTISGGCRGVSRVVLSLFFSAALLPGLVSGAYPIEPGPAQPVPGDGDVDLVVLHPGQIRFEDERVRRLPNVEVRCKRALRQWAQGSFEPLEGAPVGQVPHQRFKPRQGGLRGRLPNDVSHVCASR